MWQDFWCHQGRNSFMEYQTDLTFFLTMISTGCSLIHRTNKISWGLSVTVAKLGRIFLGFVEIVVSYLLSIIDLTEKLLCKFKQGLISLLCFFFFLILNSDEVVNSPTFTMLLALQESCWSVQITNFFPLEFWKALLKKSYSSKQLNWDDFKSVQLTIYSN